LLSKCSRKTNESRKNRRRIISIMRSRNMLRIRIMRRKIRVRTRKKKNWIVVVTARND
jgi:hypothetical protein